MAETTKENVAKTTKKKVVNSFGIKKDTRGASSLKFKLSPEQYDGLQLGCLKEVTKGEASYGDSQKGHFAEFAGKTVPTVNFVFEGVPAVGSKVAPLYIHSYKPMPIIAGTNEYAWFYDSMFQTIKHFIDVLSGDKFRDEYENLLNLAVNLEEGMTFEDLVEVYEEFIDGILTVFNGKDELPSLIKDENGNPILIWMKMLLYYNAKGVTKEVNNGNAGFTGYPGEGLIELYVDGVKPNLRIQVEKGESIIPKVKTSNAPNAPLSQSTGVPSATAPTGGVQGSAIPSFMQGK